MKDKILNRIERDRAAIVDFCAKLVRCNTSSSHGDTRFAAELIKNYFAAENIGFREIAACKTMSNLVATTEMAKVGRHLMLNGHLDVMPAGNEAGWTVPPWSGTIRDGKIIGRGTGFLFKKIPELMRADSVLTGEPSGVDAISFSSKGYIQITVKVTTRGAIAGYSNESRSAIEVAAEIIRDLKELENFHVEIPASLQKFLNEPNYRKLHEKVRGAEHLEQLTRVTVDICTIKGGSLSTVIAADCKFVAAIVIPLGTEVEALISEIKSIVERYPEAALTIDGVDLPEISPPDGELAKVLSEAIVTLGKVKPVMTPDIALSDCRYWRYSGIPAYWYGAGGELCSAANEFVTVDDLIHVTKVHALAILYYLSDNAE